MKNFGEAFVNLWENLAGIQTDDKSKLYRIVFFTVLILGSAWAVMNYVNSESFSDLSTDAPGLPPRSRRDAKIETLIEQVNTVNAKRDKGAILAGSMTAMNRRLFNDDLGYEYTGTGVGGEINLAEVENPFVVPDGAVEMVIEPPKIEVKAVMTSGKNRLAVINTENASGLIVKRGFKLPDDSGQITAINKDSITLRYLSRNFVYPIGEQATEAEKKEKEERKSLRENMQSRRDIADLYK